MNIPKPLLNFQELFLLGEEIPTCPYCGARTDIILDFSHTICSTQIHECLNEECGFEFVLISDEVKIL